MARATPRIVERLREHGVIAVHWFAAFHGEPVVWLVTETDAQKALVAERGFFRDVVCQMLSDAGIAEELAARAGVTVESEETVNRDFEGDWFSVMR